MKNKKFLSVEQGWLARLGLSDTPPLISSPSAPESEEHRRNCLAWHLLCTKSRQDLQQWLSAQSTRMAMDMRLRLNVLRDQVREMRQ